MRSQDVETSLGRLAMFELGESGLPTLLWPSLYADHRSLLPIATELARTRRCILVDGFGHGRSANPTRRYTLADCADAAQQVMDKLGIDSVDWIGNALGGHVGVHVALRAPARLRTLTVIGAPMNAISRALQWQTRFGLALYALGARGLIGRMIGKAMVSPKSPEHADHVHACLRDSPPGGIRNAAISLSLRRASLVEELPRITVPTLFVAGSDDALWPPDLAREHANRIPGSRFELVPDAGHLVPLERPRETLAVIESFLAAERTAAASQIGTLRA